MNFKILFVCIMFITNICFAQTKTIHFETDSFAVLKVIKLTKTSSVNGNKYNSTSELFEKIDDLK